MTPEGLETLKVQAEQTQASQSAYLILNFSKNAEVVNVTEFPSSPSDSVVSKAVLPLPESQANLKRIEALSSSTPTEDEDSKEEEKEMSECLPGFPADSKLANWLENMTLVVILVSVAVFCLETLPKYRLDANGEERTDDHPTFFAIESACIAWFTIEYILRFTAAKDRRSFPFKPLNMVDLIAILPYYIALGIGSSGASSLAVVRILRLTRVTRLLKFSRHSQGLQDLIACMAATRSQLVLFFLITMVSTILFASAMFYAEKSDFDTECEATFCFTSIPAAQWWAIVTMTTVGYGDMFPSTVQGKVIGAITASIGVILLAIPAGIFISEFMRIHEERKKLQSGAINNKSPDQVLADMESLLAEITSDITALRSKHDIDMGLAVARNPAPFTSMLVKSGRVAPGYYKGKIGIRF